MKEHIQQMLYAIVNGDDEKAQDSFSAYANVKSSEIIKTSLSEPEHTPKLTESLKYETQEKIRRWVQELGEHKTAYKLVKIAVSKIVPIDLEDLPDSATLADSIDGIVDRLQDNDFEGAWSEAKTAANDVLADEGYIDED